MKPPTIIDILTARQHAQKQYRAYEKADWPMDARLELIKIVALERWLRQRDAACKARRKAGAKPAQYRRKTERSW